MSSLPAVLSERRGRVLLITLNRPHVLNAINEALSSGLVAAVAELDQDSDLVVGVLSGAGRAFCAGMDLKAFSQGENTGPLLDFVRAGSTKPLIAAVDGLAYGGGTELALTCDLIVASTNARFALPEVKVGVLAAAGGLLRLPTRVGAGKAMEMALTGAPIEAADAYERGLAVRLTEPGQATAEAIRLAEAIAANAPLSVVASKRLVRASFGVSEEEYWALQTPLRDQVASSNDAREGSRAFVEKRPPRWSGS